VIGDLGAAVRGYCFGAINALLEASNDPDVLANGYVTEWNALPETHHLRRL
jgi:hypothetical protein